MSTFDSEVEIKACKATGSVTGTDKVGMEFLKMASSMDNTTDPAELTIIHNV